MIATEIEQHSIALSNDQQCISSVSKLDFSLYDSVIFLHCDSVLTSLLPIMRSKYGHLFIIIFSDVANESAKFRENMFNHGCNMVTCDVSAISHVHQLIANAKSNITNLKNTHFIPVRFHSAQFHI